MNSFEKLRNSIGVRLEQAEKSDFTKFSKAEILAEAKSRMNKTKQART